MFSPGSRITNPVRRLYLQVYLTVVGTLVVLVLIASLLWRAALESSDFDQTIAVAGELASAALPPSDAPADRQQAALDELHRRLHADLALYRQDGAPIAAAGKPLPQLDTERTHGGWLRGAGRPSWALRLNDGRWLVARLPHGHRNPGWWLAAFLGLIGLAVALCAYPVVRWITRRIERLRSGVEQLGRGDLAARVPVQGKDEVAALARSFNRAASRIQELVRSHKMLLANCSHELRTPLARIRMGIELAQGESDARHREELRRDIAELDGLIDEILLASRLDTLKAPEHGEDVELLALAAEEAARYDNAVEGTPVLVHGDPTLLRRMIRNLLDNASRHGGGAPVEVTVAGGKVDAVLTVSDRGPGVPDTEREKIFQPFYRAAGGGGSGLGLSLVRQIARAHGGDVTCLKRASGGTVFRIALPALVSAAMPPGEKTAARHASMS
jgi:signal transduction histidine kinase